MDDVARIVQAQLRGQAKRVNWSNDPVMWARDRLGVHLWSKQQEIAISLRDNKRTVVAASHGVGKSFLAAVLSCWWVDTHPLGDAIVMSCYTEDTEVLTRDGWKLFQDVKTGPGGDEFATRNPETKEFEWQHAFRYHEEDWDGEVIDFTARNFHLRVTPNHRMLTRWSVYKDGQVERGEIFKRADKITARGAELPATSSWTGSSPATVTFGRYTWDTKTFAAFLGAWLADGSLGAEGSNAVRLTRPPGTKGYEEFHTLLKGMLGHDHAYYDGKTWDFSCPELYAYLGPLRGAANKYIPAEVKDWATEELEELLRHYLLGDGWFQKSQGKKIAGSWRAETVSKTLADDLLEIAQKTGQFVTIKNRGIRKGGTINGRQIEGKHDVYQLLFCSSECRSATPKRTQYKGKVYCVSVPNETIYVRRNKAPVWCGNTAPTYPQINKILWEEMRKLHRNSQGTDNPLPGYITQGDEWKLSTGEIVGFGRKPADGNQHAFQGIHRKGGVLVLVDEGCGCPNELWTGAEAVTTTEDCRILAIGNPDDRNTEFGRVFLNKEYEGMWNRISIPASCTPNFTGEEVPPLLKKVLTSPQWVADAEKRWGKADARYISKVLAEFPAESASSLFPADLVTHAFNIGELNQSRGGVVQLGVDVARYGDDANTVVSYAGRVARVEDSWSGTDTVSSAHRVLQIADDVKQRLGAIWVDIRVDAVGLGAGVVDTLSARMVLLEKPWFSVREMHGSQSAPTTSGGSVHGYGNARAWWHDQLKLSMRNGSVVVEEHDVLREELAMVYYKFRNGKMYIISKDEMREKFGKSPDFSDALVYATAPAEDELAAGTEISASPDDMLRELALEDYLEQQEFMISPY